jgi:hypothetical protein
MAPHIDRPRAADGDDKAELRSQTYDQLLAEFGTDRPASDAVVYLQNLGYSKSQARNAVYRFRQRRGLTGK